MQEKRRQEFLKSKETKKAMDAYSKQDTCVRIEKQTQEQWQTELSQQMVLLEA